MYVRCHTNAMRNENNYVVQGDSEVNVPTSTSGESFGGLCANARMVSV